MERQCSLRGVQEPRHLHPVSQVVVNGRSHTNPSSCSFLTKIADQTMCLISPEHAQKMVWKEAAVEDDNADLDEDADRFFTFEVAKTNEQEEDVAVRPGIRVGTLHRSIRELTFMTVPLALAGRPRWCCGEQHRWGHTRAAFDRWRNHAGLRDDSLRCSEIRGPSDPVPTVQQDPD